MNILVIDDQEEKNVVYQNLSAIHSGENNAVRFLNKREELSRLSDLMKDMDVVLLDVSLSNWAGVDSDFVAQSLRETDNDVLVFLVTSQWSQVSMSYIESLQSKYQLDKRLINFNDLKTEEQKNNPDLHFDNFLGLTTDSWLNRNTTLRIVHMLQKSVSEKFEQKNLGLEPNDSVYILHLSDMQQGGNTLFDNMFDPHRIAQSVINEIGTSPNFVIVTGDIAESGKRNEYELAGKWFKSMCENFEWEEPFERVFFVPGNHDVDASLAASFKLQYIRKAEADSSEAKEKKLVRGINYISEKSIEPSLYDELNELAFNAYDKFVSGFTGIPSSAGREHYWVSTEYVNLGFIFFGINTAKVTSERSDFYYAQCQEGLNALAEEIRVATTKLEGKELLVVGLGHHGKVADENLFTSFESLFKLPHVLFFGHEHRYHERETPGKRKFNCVAPTSSLAALDRVKEATRGFNLYEFKRDCGKPQKVRVTRFSVSDSDWIPHYVKEVSLS